MTSEPMDIDTAPTTKSDVPNKFIPWVEKYRPAKVDDVAHQEEVIKTLKTSIEQGSLPHLLFHGPPGTGKTTTILAVARALYGPDLYKSRILELNASDERGISVVREKIKTFAQGAVGTQKTSGYPCPRFKLIILDEADTMTPDAQAALRRVMETYAKVTRFCLVCNYVTRVIEPLASRCAKFRFKPLPVVSMQERILHIAALEGVKLAEGGLDAILTACGGDMRKAVTYLQSSHQLTGGAPITPNLITEISGKVPDNVLKSLWDAMLKFDFEMLRQEVHSITSEGYPVAAFLCQLHDMIIDSSTLKDIDKAYMTEKIAIAEQNLLDGSSEHLQLLDVSAFITRRLNGHTADVDVIPMNR